MVPFLSISSMYFCRSRYYSLNPCPFIYLFVCFIPRWQFSHLSLLPPPHCTTLTVCLLFLFLFRKSQYSQGYQQHGTSSMVRLTLHLLFNYPYTLQHSSTEHQSFTFKTTFWSSNKSPQIQNLPLWKFWAVLKMVLMSEWWNSQNSSY